tara:strand:- start:2356 stop:4107 length:1752 start_codon:yes stop_codon:yes gene_type:complete
MANISHFYDGQLRRFIIQFTRMMSNFQYETGKDGDGNKALIKVPVRYGDINRQVANILRQGSENALVSVPQMATYIQSLTYDRPRMQEPTHIDKIHVRERSYDSETNTYSGNQGNQHTIERIMPVPFELTMKCDLFTNNTDQKLQILEQILVLFNPALELQTTDNWVDWTSLSYAEITDLTFTSRTIPSGTDDEIDVASMTFTLPIWLTPPAKIKKLGVIEKIVASLYDEDASKIDVTGIIGSDLLSRQEITFGNYGLYVEGNKVRLLQSRDTLNEKTGDAAHVSPTREDAKTDTQLVYGREIPWTKVLGAFGRITNGLSKIKLETNITTANNEDTVTYITGTIAEHPTEEHNLLFTLDTDTIPTDTVPQFTKIIDPSVTGPTGSEVDGERYLITQPIGTSLHDLNITSITHDGTTTATVTCSLPHGLAVGDTVRITGAIPNYYNGTIGVKAVPGNTTFTYNTVAATNAAASSTAQTADLNTFTAAGGVLITPSPLTSPAIGKPQGVTNRGPSAWGNLVASESDIIQYNSSTGKFNVDFDSSNVTNVQYATNNNTSVQFKWTGTQWQKSWEGEYKPGDWVLDL